VNTVMRALHRSLATGDLDQAAACARLFAGRDGRSVRRTWPGVTYLARRHPKVLLGALRDAGVTAGGRIKRMLVPAARLPSEDALDAGPVRR
jgi:hypothetical protein